MGHSRFRNYSAEGIILVLLMAIVLIMGQTIVNPIKHASASSTGIGGSDSGKISGKNVAIGGRGSGGGD